MNTEKKLSGEVSIIGDKSISHRSIIFGSLSEGVCEFSNVLISGDTIATIEIFRSLGVSIEIVEQNSVIIHGVGLQGLSKSENALNAKIFEADSLNFLKSLLARQNFASELIGSTQLTKRPMGRIVNLLKDYGSNIESDNGFLPIRFEAMASSFNSINTIVPSAQVKSALIIAALYHQEPTVITEDILTRDHTERMLTYMGIGLVRMGASITVPPNQSIKPSSYRIPSDISSAAFLIAIAILSPGEIVLSKVLINERRIGFLKILKRMNANIEINNIIEIGNEVVGDIRVSKSELVATQIEPQEVPDLIDEIPILTFLASQAEGKTTLRGAEELRIKESDRLESMKNFIQTLNGKIVMYPDGFDISGKQDLDAGIIQTEDDHRISMTALVANITLGKKISPDSTKCISDSYPTFFEDLDEIGAEIVE